MGVTVIMPYVGTMADSNLRGLVGGKYTIVSTGHANASTLFVHSCFTSYSIMLASSTLICMWFCQPGLKYRLVMNEFISVSNGLFMHELFSYLNHVFVLVYVPSMVTCSVELLTG